MILRRFPNDNLLTEPLKRISPLQFLQLFRRVLIEKLVDRHEAAADTDYTID